MTVENAPITEIAVLSETGEPVLKVERELNEDYHPVRIWIALPGNSHTPIGISSWAEATALMDALKRMTDEVWPEAGGDQDR